jgi:hypothetical protein
VELPDPKAVTERLPLTYGDRVIMENQLDARQARHAKQMVEMVGKLKTVAWVAALLSLGSLVVQLARIMSMDIHH